MSKASAAGDDPLTTAEEVEDTSGEDQPLRTLSHDGVLDEIEDLALRYNLSSDLDILQRAAGLLTADEDTLPGITPEELSALPRESTSKWHQPWTLYFTILVCSLGAIEQGWAQTGMNGANLYLPNAMGIDSSSTHDAFVLGLLNCGLYFANACWGSWLSEPVNRRLGRRGAVAVANAFCLAGNLGSGISGRWPVLLLFRLVLGTGLGLNASTVSILAAESAPPYIRGGLATSWQMFTAFGILLGFLANVAFYDFGRDSIWRCQLAAPLVPTIPLLLLVYLCPESPAWHFKRDQYREGYASLVRLRNTKLQAARETYSAYLVRRNASKLDAGPQTFTSKLASLFTIPRNRHAMYASYTVMLSQQICGINSKPSFTHCRPNHPLITPPSPTVIAFYSTTIFSTSTTSSTSSLTALWASVAFGAVNFLGAIPAIWTTDSFGRRPLLLWTLPFMALTMSLAGLTFTLPTSTTQFVLLAGLIYFFCALYSPGMGPIPIPYSAEIYPPSVREVGMSFAISTASTWATVLSLTFPALLGGVGEAGTFGLYAGLNLVAWGLCWSFVREVKGKGLEEMDGVFEPKPSRFVREMWAESWFGGARRKTGKGWLAIGQQEDGED